MLAVFVVVVATLVGALIAQSMAPSSFSAASPVDFRRSDPFPAPLGIESEQLLLDDRDRRHPLGKEDGVVPEGVTVFDDGTPVVAKLDRVLVAALRRAANDAADDGVELLVDSGWRSPEYQEQLLREAVSKYGSEKEAARWVATADTSAHVSGHAVDVGPADAIAWLSRHGAQYGLCQIYRNEPWHYELRPGAIRSGCPPMYPDPTRDPRMRQ
jgi:D-alanyl-D-alanine carboxypeptidase